MLDNFSIILLAAGLSTRMGGEQKLTKMLAGRPLLDHALGLICKLPFRQHVVVASERVNPQKGQHTPHVQWIQDPLSANGMGHSIAIGARAIKLPAAGIFIALADMPFIEEQDYRLLASAFQGSAHQRTICVPFHKKHRGHPVLFSMHFLPELCTLSGDKGARKLLQAKSSHVIEAGGCSAGTLIDLDTPEAFTWAERYLNESN